MTKASALILASAALAAVAVAGTPASGAGAAASTPKCNAKNFAGALIQIQGAAGSGFGQLILVNKSKTTCHSSGFIGGTFLGPAGQGLQTTITHEAFSSSANCKAAKPCVVVPGSALRADLHWSHIPVASQQSCEKTRALRVTLHGTNGTTRVNFPDTACNGDLIVRALRNPTPATND
jgi:Domain of unknown function (DUF4232)